MAGYACRGARGQAGAAKDALKSKLHQDQELFDRAYGYIREYY